MKFKNICFYIFIILFLAACEKSTETERFMLSGSEKELAPYIQNQHIKFIHSKGYEYDFKVTDVKLDFLRSYEVPGIMFQSGNYIAYQRKSVTMNSTIPYLTIKIELGYLAYSFGSPMNPETTSVDLVVDSLKELRVYLDNYYAIMYYNKNMIFNSKSDSVTCYDSVKINGKTYLNVVESKFYYHSIAKDSSPKSVLYNANGLIQIKLCNDEYFSIK